MKNYRPLLIRQLDVRLPGLRIRRLRLNRHLPDVDTVAEHSHEFAQILCYLGGSGELGVGGVLKMTGPGTVIFLPPKTRHVFHESTGARPLCLVLDLDWRGSCRRGPAAGQLGKALASEVRRDLSELTRLTDPNETGSRLVVASSVLRILDALLRSLSLVPPRSQARHPLVSRVERELRADSNCNLSIAELAARIGCNPDYLNRTFRSATGRTLREYRDGLRLDRAKLLLRKRKLVKDVASDLDFPDQNYLARWFKKQTGLTPGQFKSGFVG